MTKMFKLFLLFSVLCVGSAVAQFELTYTEVAGGLSVTGYTGTPSGDLVIPDNVGGTNVVAIGNGAFGYCSGFTGNLIIPNSVTSIGNGAFSDCFGFTGNLIIPNSVTSIGVYAFANCSQFANTVFLGNAPTLSVDIFYQTPITSISIRSSTTGWGIDYEGIPFVSTNLWLITTTSTDTTKGTTPSFYLSDYNVPVTVVATPVSSNYKLSTWKEASTNVSTSSSYTFTATKDRTLTADFDLYNRWNVLGVATNFNTLNRTNFSNSAIMVKDVILGSNSLINTLNGKAGTIDLNTAITNEAFQRVSGDVASTNYVNTFTNKIMTAWQNPASATNWTWTSDGTQITLTGYTGINDVVIPDMLDGLPVTGFGTTFSPGELGSAITSITGGNNITSIGYVAFNNCNALASASLPQATSISLYAFNNCTHLTSVSLPQATSISGYAFNNCNRLTSVSLPQATSISLYAFNSCTRLTSVNLPQATSISGYAFNNCNALASASLPQATSISGYAFANCTHLTSVSLPQATSISGYAFANCTALTSASLPQATSISLYAFNNCTHITSVTFGQNAPAEATDVYAGSPSVTNYVTNPTATGWGPMWNGRPVVQLPITTTIPMSNVTGLTNWMSTNVFGVLVSVSGGLTATTNNGTTTISVIPTKTIYQVNVDNTTSLLFDFSALNFTNKIATFEVHIAYVNTNAAITFLDSANIYWVSGVPTFITVATNYFSFRAFSTNSIHANLMYSK